jgi:hypothetical protein
MFHMLRQIVSISDIPSNSVIPIGASVSLRGLQRLCSAAAVAENLSATIHFAWGPSISVCVHWQPVDRNCSAVQKAAQHIRAAQCNLGGI